MSDPTKSAKPVKPRMPGWFCGAATDLSRRFRIAAFLMLALISVSLCFSQFGIMAYGDDLSGNLSFMFFLVPVALCMVMLGAAPGIALAVITGLAIFYRTGWTPTSAYDAHLADPLLSVVSITVGAILMAAIVTPAARRWPANLSWGVYQWKRLCPARVISLVLGCFIFALVFSYGTRGIVYLVIAPGGEEYGYASIIQDYLASTRNPIVFLEVVLNTIIMGAVCFISVVQDANRRAGSWKSSINSTFTRWLAFVMLVVFVLASAVSFCYETIQATSEAEGKILAELQYLQQQVEDREQADASVSNVANGYTSALGGTVAVVRNHIVVSSNDPDLIGRPAVDVLSSSGLDNFDFLVEVASEEMLTGSSEEYQEFFGIRTLKGNHYVFIEAAPLSVMYKERTSTTLYNSLFFLLMLTVAFVVTRLLLKYIVIQPIRRTNEKLSHITKGELSCRVDEGAVLEFEELSSGINTTVVSLKDMMDEIDQRNKQDLMAAKAIQEQALPREFPPFPEIDRFDIYASLKMARAVGGDFYDFFLTDDGKLAFLIADVSGKGIPAALFMMTAKTQIKSYLESGMPVDEAVGAANHQLCLSNDAGMFVTMFACVLDHQTGLLSYVNAGHNPPLLNHGGQWEWMREVSGMPLGLFDGLPYNRSDYQMAPTDTLYLYTDGVTEAMDKDGVLFGEDRLLNTLRSYEGMNARSMSVGVRRAITDFTLDAEQSDDITMLTMRYGVPPEKGAVMVLPANVKQLIHVYNFIHEELKRRDAPKSVYGALDIAAEELFVNICHYAYPNATPEEPGEARVGFEYTPNPPALTVSISDDGVPYNPLEKPDAVTPDRIEDVPIGGLGILMTKRSVDDMTYERKGDSNVVTFRKCW